MIVGASSGIGAAIARQLELEGNEVIAISRTNANNLKGYVFADVLDENTFPEVEGPLDGLVYCPGSIHLRPVKGLKVSDFQNDMELNFLGLVRIVKKYLPQVVLGNQPAIVLFSTVAVQTGMPFHTSIAAAKGAVEGYGRSLAAELAPKVRVNIIAPSLTDTPLASRLLDGDIKRQSAQDRHPLKQIGQSDDLAALAVWLLSDHAKFMTGQVRGIDGGISALKV